MHRNDLIEDDSFFKNNFKKEKTSPLVSIIKFCIHHSPAVSSDTLKNVLASFDALSSNQDELTLLVLENCLLDVLLHKQKIQIRDFTECRGSDCCGGSFCAATRTISIINFPNLMDFSNVLIHEFMHAVSCFAFRFDPFPWSLGYSDSAFSYAVSKFLSPSILPHHVGDNLPREYEFQYLNPSALKFKQCVREDLKHAKEDTMQLNITTTEKLDKFFSDFERHFPDGILENNALEEILPVYMECRIELLQIANAQGLSKEQALNALANKLPRIHDYCETDLKKVLAHRLEKFRPALDMHFIESQFLAKQTRPADGAKVKTCFRTNGTLYLQQHNRKTNTRKNDDATDKKRKARL